MEFNRLTKILGLCCLILLAPCAYADKATDDDILDDLIPTLVSVIEAKKDADAIQAALLAKKQKAAGVITIPIDLPKKKTNAWILGFKKEVYVKRKGNLLVTPPNGYKVCSYRVRYNSQSNKAAVSAVRLPSDLNKALINYDVPCGGGGAAIKDVNKAISTAVVAAIVYFSAGTGSTLANVLGNASYSDFLYASTWVEAEAFQYTVNSLLNQGLLSSGIERVLNLNYKEGLCGVGDAGNWLLANVDFMVTPTTTQCKNIPEWQSL